MQSKVCSAMPGLAKTRKMQHKSEISYQQEDNKMSSKRVGVESSSQLPGPAKKIKTEPADFTEQSYGISNQPNKMKKQDEQTSQISSSCWELQEDSKSTALITPKPEEVINMVPHRASTHFTGREYEIQCLASALQSKQRNQLISVAVTGPPGVGKTELVLKSIETHAAIFDHILWINGENDLSVQESFIKIAIKLNIINIIHDEVPDFEIFINKIYKILSQYKCLVIFDNIFTDIQKYLPCIGIDTSSLFLIVTSQDTEWSCSLQIFLDYFTPEISRTFIGKQVDKNICTDIDIQKLAEMFGHIPLALQIALSYIKFQDELLQFDDKHYSIKDFIHEFYACPEAIPNFMFSSNQVSPLASIWNNAIRATSEAESGKLALKLLGMMAFMQSDDMPSSLFKFLPEIEHELEINKALRLLKKYSLITNNGDKVSMHRLLQNVLRNSCAGKEDTISELLHLFICKIKKSASFQSDSYLHSAIRSWSYASHYDELVKKFSSVAEAIVACETLPHDETIHFIEKYLKLLERVLGKKNNTFLRIQKSYITILVIKGECEKALKICDKILTEISNEPNLNYLALKFLFSKSQIMHKLGRLDEEWNICNDIYQQQKICPGVDHEDTLRTLETMAKVSGTLSKGGNQKPMKLCLALLRHTVHHSEKNHLKILAIAKTVSQNLLDRKEKEKALQLHGNIYITFKKKIGKYHKDTLQSLIGRAFCLWKIGKIKEAWKTYNILNLLRKRLNYDAKNLDLIVEMCKTACLLDIDGNSEALDSCLAYIKERVKNPKEDSEKTLKSIIILTHRIKQSEKKSEVLPLYDTLCATLAKEKGETHPLTLKVLLEKCSCLCHSMNKLRDGWLVYKAVCKMCNVKPEPRPENETDFFKLLNDLGAAIIEKR